MKLHYTKWGTNSKGWQFATPYINIIRHVGNYTKNYIQISFVIEIIIGRY